MNQTLMLSSYICALAYPQTKITVLLARAQVSPNGMMMVAVSSWLQASETDLSLQCVSGILATEHTRVHVHMHTRTHAYGTKEHSMVPTSKHFLSLSG